MKQTVREINDVLISKAAEKSLDELLTSLPEISELEDKYEFSIGHQRKMNRLFSKAKRRSGTEGDSWKKFRRFSYNAAAVICMFFTVFALAAFTIPPVRTALANYVLEYSEKYVKIGISSEENEASFTEYEGEPGYIPEGYVVKDVKDFDSVFMIEYINEGEQFIKFSRYIGDVKIALDNEDSDFKEIYINGLKGYSTEKKGLVNIVFHDGTYTYTLFSEASYEETFKIAESIKTE